MDTPTPAPAPQSTQTPPPAPSGPTKNIAMAMLAYIGPLVIVSYLTAKDDTFVKFHIKQGLVLVVIEVAIWVVSTVAWFLWPVLQIINIAAVILAIVGIVRAVKGEERELPLVGKYAVNFKI